MPEEHILYTFDGDASNLQAAAAKAMDSLQQVDNAENQLASNNPFSSIAQSVEKLNAHYTTLKAALSSITQGITSARSASESLKGSFGGTVANVASYVMQLRDAYNAGASFGSSTPVISGLSTVWGVLKDSISSANPQIEEAQQAINAFGNYLSQTSMYAQLFSQSTGPIQNALSYITTMANAAADGFQQFISPIIRARESMGGISDSADNAGDAIDEYSNRTNEASKKTEKFISKGSKLSSTFSGVGKVFKSLGSVISKAFSSGVSVASSALNALGISLNSLALGEAIKQSNQYIEALNLFQVAAGDTVKSMQANVDILEYYGGLAPATIMQATGSFKMLATEMGISSKRAADMSSSLTNVAVDLSSLFNTDFETAMNDLESGMQGMTKSVRKYGIDISEASLKETAASLGIAKNIENMSQAEKMQIRYATVIRQTSLAQTDFARTIETPANMLKILKEQVLETARAIGNFFQPVLQIILPALIKFALAIKSVVSVLASLVGYKAPEIKTPDSSAYSTAAASAGDLADNTDKAAKSQKKLNNLLGGFDEINAQQNPKDSSGGSGTGGISTGGDLGFELPMYDNMLALSNFMPTLRAEADQIANSFMNWLNPIIQAYQAVKEYWGPVVDNLKNAGSTLLPTIAQGVQSIATGGLAEFFTSLATSLTPVIEPLTNLANSILPHLVDIINETFSLVSEDMLSPAIASIGKLAKHLGSPIEKVFKNLSNLMSNISDKVGPSLSKFIDNFTSDILPPLTTILGFLGDLLGNITGPLTDIMNDILPFISSLISMLAKILNPILEATLPSLNKLLTDVLSHLSSLLQKVLPPLLDLLDAILQPLGDMLADLLPVLIDCIDDILNAIAPLLEDVLPPLLSIITAIIKPIMRILKECIIPIVDIVLQILTPILEILIDVIDMLMQILLPIIDVIIWIIDLALTPFIDILGFVIGIIQDLLGVVRDVFEKIRDFIKKCFDAVVDIFQKPIELIKKFIKIIKEDLWENGIKKYFNKIKDFLVDVFKKIIDGAIGFVNKGLEAVEWLCNKMLIPLNGIIKGLNLIPGVDIPQLKLDIPEIPKLALGGVVTDPTMAIVGEGKYDEAIIPLGDSPQMQDLISKISESIAQRGAAGTGEHQTIQVFIGNELLDEYVYNVQRRRELQTNGGF